MLSRSVLLYSVSACSRNYFAILINAFLSLSYNLCIFNFTGGDISRIFLDLRCHMQNENRSTRAAAAAIEESARAKTAERHAWNASSSAAKSALALESQESRG